MPAHSGAQPVLAITPGTGRGLSALLLCLALWAAATAAFAAEVADEFYEDAIEHYAAGRLEAAGIQLKNALQEDPDHLPSRVLLGKVSIDYGAPAAAEKELKIARSLGADENLIAVPLAQAYLALNQLDRLLDEFPPGNRPRDVEVDLAGLRGMAYLGTGNAVEADASFERAAQMAPDRASPVLGMAVAALSRGDIERAMRLADRAATIEPDSPEVWYVRGEIDRDQGRLEPALENYRRAVEVAPTHLNALSAQTATLLDLGRDKEALESVGKLMELTPKDPEALYFEAMIYERRGETQRSEESLQQASELLAERTGNISKANGPTVLLAAYVNFGKGNFEKSRNLLDGYIQLFPRSVSARILLAKALLILGEPTAAVAALEPVELLAGEDAVLHTLLASAYQRLDQHESAVASLETAASLVPGHTGLEVELSRSLSRLGRSEEAIARLEAVRTDGDLEPALATLLANLYLQAGRYQEALSLANELVAYAPESASSHNIAGAAWSGVGDLEQARLQLERALQLAPNDYGVQLNLASLDMREMRYASAQERLRQLLEHNPDNVGAMSAMARLEEQRGDIEQAIHWLEKTQLAAPGATTDALKLVDLLLRTGRFDEALKLALTLEQEEPEFVPVLFAVGRSERAAGELSKSHATFRRIATLAGFRETTLLVVANDQIAAGDLEGALWSLQKAASGSPDSLAVRVKLVELYGRLGRFDEAEAGAMEIEQTYPELAAGLSLRGDLLMAQGKQAEAVPLFEAALQKEHLAAIGLSLYSARWESGDRQGAIEGLKRWYAERPDDLGVKRALAAGYIHVGETDEAITLHEQLVVEVPDDPVLLNNLAWLYQADGDPRALRYAERAHELAPEIPIVTDTLGWILVQNGDAETALKHFRDALSRDSTNPTIRYHLAVALSALGRHEAASAELKEALQVEQFAERDDAVALLTTLEPG